jgi:hypothetical protein
MIYFPSKTYPNLMIEHLKTYRLEPNFPIICDPLERDEDGNTAMMWWIRTLYNKEVPNYIRHDPAIQNNDGDTALMLWIIYTEDVPIPSYLLYKNMDLMNNYGETAAYLYMIWRRKLPPLSLKHNPNLKIHNRFNIISCAITDVSNIDIPTWMMPTDLSVGYGAHESFIFRWYSFQRRTAPLWATQDPLKRNAQGQTAAMVHIITTETHPLPWMMHDEEIADNNEITLKEYMQDFNIQSLVKFHITKVNCIHLLELMIKMKPKEELSKEEKTGEEKSGEEKTDEDEKEIDLPTSHMKDENNTKTIKCKDCYPDGRLVYLNQNCPICRFPLIKDAYNPLVSVRDVCGHIFCVDCSQMILHTHCPICKHE